MEYSLIFHVSKKNITITSMNNSLIFESEREISSAFIDSSVRMGVAQSVLLVQDNLTESFNAMDCDGVIYREKFNAFWGVYFLLNKQKAAYITLM